MEALELSVHPCFKENSAELTGNVLWKLGNEFLYGIAQTDNSKDVAARDGGICSESL